MSRNTKSIVSQTGENVNPYDKLKRDMEIAYASGGDYADQLLDLATATAYSVIAKLCDPQRKAAPGRDTVSQSGLSPVMTAIRREIGQDRRLLDATRRTADNATRITYTVDGDAVTEIADPAAYAALSDLIRQPLGDGIDLVQTAATAILEQATDHADGGIGWLDRPYTVRRLSRQVYIRLDESAAYRNEDTTPIQEVFRAVRRAVANSRAVRTDPCNGYTYIDAETVDGMDRIYYRSGRYADLGGSDAHGLYTAGIHTVMDYYEILDRLDLTARQRQVLELRIRGYGYKAVAAYLGVDAAGIKVTIRRIRDRCRQIGIAPSDRGGD